MSQAYVRVRIFLRLSKSDELSNVSGEGLAQQNISDAQSSMDNLHTKSCIYSLLYTNALEL